MTMSSAAQFHSLGPGQKQATAFESITLASLSVTPREKGRARAARGSPRIFQENYSRMSSGYEPPNQFISIRPFKFKNY